MCQNEVNFKSISAGQAQCLLIAQMYLYALSAH